MAKVGRDFAGAVTGDLQSWNADDLGRRNLGCHVRQLGAPAHAHKLVGAICRSYAPVRDGRARDPHRQTVEDLCRQGVGAKLALNEVSFDVPRGQIFGLLGPNGAGKSTLINILAGLVVKTGGEVTIWGFDIDEHPRNAKRSIGVVPQEIIFDPFFTPRETLEIQAGLYGIPPGSGSRTSCSRRCT